MLIILFTSEKDEKNQNSIFIINYTAPNKLPILENLELKLHFSGTFAL